MKKVTLFKSAILALLVCVGFAACENNSSEVAEEPETYTVKLGWAGEILDVSYEPMATRAATDDLYGIQVYSKPKTAGSTIDWTPYAYGLFDDPSNITITLQSNSKYKFVATMIKDGKNKVYKDNNGRYKYPFTLNSFPQKFDNKFYYDGNNHLHLLGQGFTELTDNQLYRHPNIERFYGQLSNYIPSESSNVKIDMKRTVFGAKFAAGGKLAVDGILVIEMKDAPKMELALTDGDDQISDVFSFFDLEKAWAKDDYTETIDVTFKRIRTDDTTMPLGTHAITFKRNTITIVEVNIDKDGNDEGVDLDIPSSETGSMANGSTVTINDGEME